MHEKRKAIILVLYIAIADGLDLKQNKNTRLRLLNEGWIFLNKMKERYTHGLKDSGLCFPLVEIFG